MQELEDEHDFGGVELRGCGREAFRFAEVGEYFAAGAVVEEHIEGVVVGEGGYECRYERVSCDVCQDGSFVIDVVNLLEFDN